MDHLIDAHLAACCNQDIDAVAGESPPPPVKASRRHPCQLKRDLLWYYHSSFGAVACNCTPPIHGKKFQRRPPPVACLLMLASPFPSMYKFYITSDSTKTHFVVSTDACRSINPANPSEKCQPNDVGGWLIAVQFKPTVPKPFTFLQEAVSPDLHSH